MIFTMKINYLTLIAYTTCRYYLHILLAESLKIFKLQSLTVTLCPGQAEKKRFYFQTRQVVS